jgi:hypothetical protein
MPNVDENGITALMALLSTRKGTHRGRQSDIHWTKQDDMLTQDNTHNQTASG